MDNYVYTGLLVNDRLEENQRAIIFSRVYPAASVERAESIREFQIDWR